MSQIRRDLPDFSFINTDPEALLSQGVEAFEDAYFSMTGEVIKLREADPLRLLIYTGTYKHYLTLKIAEHVARQNLLAFAEGEILDYRAANYGKYEIQRLPAQSAKTTIRFSLQTAMPTAVHVPMGTKVTAGDNVFFATTASLIISPGETSGTVIAQCTETGEIGNGYTIGQLNSLVDPLPYIGSVSNINITQDGADVESDDSLRDRIYLAPEGFSVAGPSGAYEYYIKSFSTEIAHTKITSPSPGVVRIVILLKDGELPNNALITQLTTHLMDENVRPLTDFVEVVAPTTVNYNINLKYFISAYNAASENQIRSAVDDAVKSYINWQGTVIGRDIIPSKLIELIMGTGVKRVELITPSYTPLTDEMVAKIDQINVEYGGLENE